MSVEWSKWAKSVKGLSRREKQVLVWLADFYNDEKGCAWPSQDKLAEIAVYSRSTINKACKELRKKGLISWTKKMREFGQFPSNQYKLHRVAFDHMAGGHNTVYQNETSPCSKTKHKLLNRTLNRTLNGGDAIKEKEKKLTPLQNVLADNIVDKYLSSETEWYDPKSIKRDVTIYLLGDQTSESWAALGNGLKSPKEKGYLK
mgnify:CR=1 FL=1